MNQHTKANTMMQKAFKNYVYYPQHFEAICITAFSVHIARLHGAMPFLPQVCVAAHMI